MGQSLVNCVEAVKEYIDKEDWRIKANANAGYSHAGLINNLAGKIIANYWLDDVFSEEASTAHRDGTIHIHDLDCLTAYCAGWALRDLLNFGFNGVRGKTESSPPKHFDTTLGQMANFFGILQNEWAGAQAFSSFDTYLAPYVFKDQLDYIEVEYHIERFIYNVNVPSRWGQSPFTNITIDWTVPDDMKPQYPQSNDKHLFEDYKDEKLLYLAKQRDPDIEDLTDLTYEHFQPEMDLINKAFYTIMTKGDASGQPFTFPIPTVNITEDFDWNDPKTDLLFENTAKVGSSYFQNFIGSQYIEDENGNKVKDPNAFRPESVRSMCCRLRLDLTQLAKRGNGLFGSAELTGSIGVVTINMARLGYLCKGDKNKFFDELLKKMHIAKDVLHTRRAFVEKRLEKGLYPYTKRYLKTLNNHFSTIGVNGINEMIRNFTNDKHDITTQQGKDFAIEVLNWMSDKLFQFQNGQKIF